MAALRGKPERVVRFLATGAAAYAKQEEPVRYLAIGELEMRHEIAY